MKEWKEVQVLFVENKTPEEICEIRTKYTMEWYIRKAICNKRIYYALSFIGILCPLANVVAVSCSQNNSVAMILASITSVATSSLAITNARMKWENYRSAAEFLKREFTLFQARVGQYSGEQRVATYLNTTEEYMEKVHSNWQKYFVESKTENGLEKKEGHES